MLLLTASLSPTHSSSMARPLVPAGAALVQEGPPHLRPNLRYL